MTNRLVIPHRNRSHPALWDGRDENTLATENKVQQVKLPGVNDSTLSFQTEVASSSRSADSQNWTVKLMDPNAPPSQKTSSSSQAAKANSNNLRLPRIVVRPFRVTKTVPNAPSASSKPSQLHKPVTKSSHLNKEATLSVRTKLNVHDVLPVKSLSRPDKAESAVSSREARDQSSHCCTAVTSWSFHSHSDEAVNRIVRSVLRRDDRE